MSQKIKVLLVDDHPLVREGLVNLISQQADLQICGEAGNEPQALELIRTVQPHVAIVDISLESGSGIRCVLAGQLYVSNKITALMAEKFIEGRTAATASPAEQLSDRELEVFQLLGLGHNTRQIADHLHIGFKTVQAYCARIKEKLKLANANELLREAVRWQENRQAE
jgi:DNA-binding NarL/FixJ family response regulator